MKTEATTPPYDLLIDGLRDLYHAERQLKALPTLNDQQAADQKLTTFRVRSFAESTLMPRTGQGRP